MVAEPSHFDGSGSDLKKYKFCSVNKILRVFVCIILGLAGAAGLAQTPGSGSDLTKKCFGSGSVTL